MTAAHRDVDSRVRGRAFSQQAYARYTAVTSLFVFLLYLFGLRNVSSATAAECAPSVTSAPDGV